MTKSNEEKIEQMAGQKAEHIIACCSKDLLDDASQQLAGHDKQRKTLQDEQKRLAALLEKEKEHDRAQELAKIITQETSKIATEQAIKKINQFLASEVKVISENKFNKFVDNSKWDMIVPWKDMQNSYVDIISNYVKDQLIDVHANAGKIKNTKVYYLHVINDFLATKLREQNVPASQTADKLENLIMSMTMILSADKDAFSPNEIANYKADIKKEWDQLVKVYKLSKEDVNQVSALLDILNSKTTDYDDLVGKIQKFRNDICSQDGKSLYARLPDTSEGAKVFPFAKTDDAYQAYLSFFNGNRNIDAEAKKNAGLTHALTRLKELVSSVLESKAEIGKSGEPLKQMLENLKVLDNSDIKKMLDLLGIISNRNYEALAGASSAGPHARQLQAILGHPDNSDPDKLRAALKKYIESQASGEEKQPAILAAVRNKFALADEEKHQQVSKKINDIEEKSTGIRSAMAEKIDKILLGQLRMNALQAANKFLGPRKKGNIFQEKFHKLHHKEEDKEKEAVLTFLQELMSSTLTFKGGVELMQAFLKDPPGAWHSNSYGNLLLVALYNEGSPKGLFKLTSRDALSSSLLPADDVYGDTTKLKNYIQHDLKLPDNADVKGSVVNLLIGKDRLGKADKIIIKDVAMKNLLELHATNSPPGARQDQVKHQTPTPF